MIASQPFREEFSERVAQDSLKGVLHAEGGMLLTGDLATMRCCSGHDSCATFPSPEACAVAICRSLKAHYSTSDEAQENAAAARQSKAKQKDDGDGVCESKVNYIQVARYCDEVILL